ncbi:signal peptidase I [Candidatus Campbellbacteria bacterium]|nr:MAG: signal peptidase I [Candidatus Campbellbacteria bacterium]
MKIGKEYTTDSGLKYEVMKFGTGRKPQITDGAEIYYKGELEDGTVFLKKTKTRFSLEEMNLGFQEGLQLMNVGTKFKLIIPPDLHNEEEFDGLSVIFEIELLEILNQWQILLRNILDLVRIIIIALIIIIPIKYFVVEPYIVQGSSMSPNFETANYLIVSKLTGKISEINRGEVVVLIPPHEKTESWLKYSVYFDPRDKYIKRVIALPEERVVLKNNKVYIQKKDSETLEEVSEPYIKNNGTKKEVDIVLKKDEYFVLGDNRGNSLDSEEFGPIKKEDIVGSPILRLYPFDQININPADYNPKSYKFDK